MPDTFDLHGFLGLLPMALLFGARHGLDADHLAAIDGVARFNASRRPRLARAAGLLFSLGHGAVVIGVALAASALATNWRIPAWLDAAGAWLSIGVLSVIALINIASVLRTPADEHATLIGWRAEVFGWLLAAGSAPMVLGVGALFALSFDTLSQASLFAVTAARHGGAFGAGLLAAVFVVGLLAMDGAHGLWIAVLLRRSDRSARLASRVMTLTVAGIGLATAGLGVVLQTSPAAAAWAQGKEVWFGLAVVAIVCTGFGLAMRLAGGRGNARSWSLRSKAGPEAPT